jgi:hypothetical protein
MKVHQHNDKTGKRAIITKQTLASFPRLHLNTLVLTVVMMIATSGLAQRQEQVADFNNNRLTSTTIQNINIVYNTGKVYINWMVKGEKVDGIYLVERSVDGKAFTAVGFKEVVASNLELLYSWIDNEPMDGNSFYRISRIGQNYEQEVMTASIPLLNIGSENKVNTASSANDTKKVK